MDDIKKSFLIFLVVIGVAFLPMTELLNLSAYNRKFKARAFQTKIFKGVEALKPKTDIVILAIDNESIDWIGKWPWPRKFHAKIVDTLMNAGAKLIAFDVFFDSPTQFNPQDDQEFADAIKRAGNVLVAANFQNVEKKEGMVYSGLPFKRPIELIDKAALDIGVVHPEPDPDNQIRRFQILYRSKSQFYNSLALQVVRYFQKTPDVVAENASLIKLGKYSIPLESAKLRINYFGGEKSFPTVPYVRVFDGTFLKDFPDFFKDKIVLIGASAIVLHDVFPTPFDRALPGVEIHANVIQTILDQVYIKKISFTIVLGLLMFLVYLNVRLTKNMPIKRFFLFVLGQIGIIYVVLTSLFLFFRLEVPTYSLGSAVLMTFIIQTIIRYIKEEKEKRKIRGVFSQYVAPSVVNELLANPESVELGGVNKEVTIFFSDVRAFTTFSEAHTPKEIVKRLNEYLDAMTQVIFDHGGTLDKYVGDEIMAIFGAPLPLENHAKAAVKCCIAQFFKLRELQQQWKEEGVQGLDMGMGLNTGEVIVGNIGSTQYKDYTVIGDAVNLAARLEAATRNYGREDYLCYLLISEYTYNLIKDEYECRFVDEIAVKGKNEKTKIYEIVLDERDPENILR